MNYLKIPERIRHGDQFVIRHSSFVVFFWLGLLTGCQQNKSTDDPEKLKQVLFNYFDGIKRRDYKIMIESTTDDFSLFEEGKAWINDSVFMEMKRFPYKTAEFKFDNFKINVDNMSGYMSYFENAVFVMNDTTRYNLYFLGSAAFRKNENGWKMSFLHSTKKYVRKKK